MYKISLKSQCDHFLFTANYFFMEVYGMNHNDADISAKLRTVGVCVRDRIHYRSFRGLIFWRPYYAGSSFRFSLCPAF